MEWCARVSVTRAGAAGVRLDRDVCAGTDRDARLGHRSGCCARVGVVQAKKFVEESPKVLKEAATKDEAAKIKADLEKLGAKVSIE